MALPVSPNAISLGQVNTELGISPSTTEISLNQAAVRALFVMSSGQIRMSDGHGKSAQSAPVIPGTTNYGVNDRTWSGYITQYNEIASSYASPTHSATGNRTLSFNAATGGNIAYEWQFLPYNRFNSIAYNCPTYPHTPLVASAQPWQGPNGYNDYLTGASTNSIIISARPYQSNGVTTRGIGGFWRLKASNSVGATYTEWQIVSKVYGTYTYNCNPYCPSACEVFVDCNCGCPAGCGTYNCNCYDCNCQCDCQYDENNQPYDCTTCCSTCCDTCCNCVPTCDQCFDSCNCPDAYDTCSGFMLNDAGIYNQCNW